MPIHSKEELMNTLDQLRAQLAQTDGMLNIKDALRIGFSKSTVDQLIAEDQMHKLTSNIYLTKEAAQDEMFMIRTYSNDAVFSHETALYLHHLADSNVLRWVVTVPAGYSAVHLRTIGTKVHFMKKDLFKLGLIETKSPYGRTIFTYDAERTICDILMDKNNLSSAILEEALIRYAANPGKDLELLVYYARQFKIEGMIKNYGDLLGL